MNFRAQPAKHSLYNPNAQRDSCGLGFVADINGVGGRHIVEKGLGLLCRLTHRGAVGADPLVSDGVGILTRLPHRFFQRKFKAVGNQGEYAVAMVFIARNRLQPSKAKIERIAQEEGLILNQWRAVPVKTSCLGKTIKTSSPLPYQALLTKAPNQSPKATKANSSQETSSQKNTSKPQPKKRPSSEDALTLEQRLYLFRQRASNEMKEGCHIASASSATIVYKAMAMAEHLSDYYPDLQQPDFASPLALVHQRFSTNTFPSWDLAHPFRMLCHNGEINTLRGNLNWMHARQQITKIPAFGAAVKRLFPLMNETLSDSACLDRALEFLISGGYSPAKAILTLIPQAWQKNPQMNPKLKHFYRHQAAITEPWDGPAAVAFTDGFQIGAVLDRNGLRPVRTVLTKSGLLVLASEAGVLDLKDEEIIQKGRLQPGEILLADLKQKRIIKSEEVKQTLANEQDWQKLNRTFEIAKLPQVALPTQTASSATSHSKTKTTTRTAKKFPEVNTTLKRCFGYTREDEEFYLKPMASSGVEPTGSMGVDTPPAVLSSKNKLLFNYFKQCFAQVTNPAIDPIRENLVMSLISFVGEKPPLFGTSNQTKYLAVASPVLDHKLYQQILASPLKAVEIDICRSKTESLKAHLARLVKAATSAVKKGTRLVVLTDKKASQRAIPTPSVLATSTVHHGLIKAGLRFRTSIAVSTGEAREPHHFAVLGGYGAELIHPWAALEIIQQLGGGGKSGVANYLKALDKALLKIMAKMGISTFQSYCGAQVFDSIGLAENFVAQYFPGTTARLGGIGLAEVEAQVNERHLNAFRAAFGGDSSAFGSAIEGIPSATISQPASKQMANKQQGKLAQPTLLEEGGDYAFRIGGETHAWTPQTVADLQHSVRGNNPQKYNEFAKAINNQNRLTLRGLLRFVAKNKKVALTKVEPASKIVQRFSTGAMSFGSISYEAHSTLAVAMNRIGGKSNTGEGGEEAERFTPRKNGDSARSAIKQVASGRFGVTTEYLANSDMMQIKICQGAKPGEGGQLPGHKVNETIATVRHSTPGVGLISPPPHHDIYSIEDLAQLIFDLKNTNPKAAVSVKLASEAGVGTVAAGVTKARADHITIAGYEGGTGASPLTSIKHTGLPWEIGLAETHQTLVGERLRSRVAVQVDGGLRTGRDVVVAAMLGADEFGFATAPLIAVGCLMMRKCHLNTCPVGIATQNPILRKRFTGTPENVVNYLFFVAEEVRQIMAELGFTKFNQLIGKTECLAQRTEQSNTNQKSTNQKGVNQSSTQQNSTNQSSANQNGLWLKPLLAKATPAKGDSTYNSTTQNHPLQGVLDKKLIAQAAPALKSGKQVKISAPIGNTDRSTGAMLSGAVAKKYRHKGLPPDTIQVELNGTAGQSFGAFLANGVTLKLKGEGNDYVGKGLSGGKIIIYPPSDFRPRHQNVIVGNTVLYGALEGELYASGLAGERFAVRNSGALAVIEGVGDHCCEYMTGGFVLCLGGYGRNFAAGMSGGIAYVYNGIKIATEEAVEVAPLTSFKDTAPPTKLATKLTTKPATRLTHSELTTAPLEHHQWRIKALLERHHHWTRSPLAAELLTHWNTTKQRFAVLTPLEFRRAILTKTTANLKKSA